MDTNGVTTLMKSSEMLIEQEWLPVIGATEIGGGRAADWQRARRTPGRHAAGAAQEVRRRKEHRSGRAGRPGLAGQAAGQERRRLAA